MNRKRTVFIATLLILLSLTVTVVLWMQNHGRMNFSATKIEDCCQANFTWWTGAAQHSLLLEKGDVLQVDWKLERGRIGIVIEKPSQRPIYAAKDVSAKDTPEASFAVVVPEAGEYTITVSGKNATAGVSVKRAEDSSEASDGSAK